MASLKFYNEKTYQQRIVWQRLERSGKFGWSWCKDTHQPLRHVAIVLFFDTDPVYTVNFRTKDGASKASAAFGEVEPLITIEEAPKSGFIFFQPLEEFEVVSPKGRELAQKRIRSIIFYDPGSYSLFTNNCRDHVKGVVRTVLGKTLADDEFERDMIDVTNEDTIWKYGAAAAAIAAIGTIAVGVSALFGAQEEKERRQEK